MSQKLFLQLFPLWEGQRTHRVGQKWNNTVCNDNLAEHFLLSPFKLDISSHSTYLMCSNQSKKCQEDLSLIAPFLCFLILYQSMVSFCYKGLHRRPFSASRVLTLGHIAPLDPKSSKNHMEQESSPWVSNSKYWLNYDSSSSFLYLKNHRFWTRDPPLEGWACH